MRTRFPWWFESLESCVTLRGAEWFKVACSSLFSPCNKKVMSSVWRIKWKGGIQIRQRWTQVTPRGLAAQENNAYRGIIACVPSGVTFILSGAVSNTHTSNITLPRFHGLCVCEYLCMHACAYVCMHASKQASRIVSQNNRKNKLDISASSPLSLFFFLC